ncbi:DNA-3-methyladenine glycosylase [bacterium BMS3Abin03]|jgi:DNA-3-methyladenine glycosylase|nr:DNA-3-methyladenine glycosylase [bacterium BMS3Abin03]MCG6958565.1 DNA-3-methyladenine glycosylase [bacterium BMS3Abin03]
MNITHIKEKIRREFYQRDVLTVAKELPGKILVKKKGKSYLSGRIVEVEAYDGEIDQAAHSYLGRTKRNEIMFGEGGYLYVYLSYGVHFCCNVVTGVKNKGTAILIRAVEPIEGIGIMSKNRFGKKSLTEKEMNNLTSGPGKVCKAFGIGISHYGIDLTGDKIFLLNADLKKGEKIISSKRIGITKSAHLPWRFFIKNNPYLSRK